MLPANAAACSKPGGGVGFVEIDLAVALIGSDDEVMTLREFQGALQIVMLATAPVGLLGEHRNNSWQRFQTSSGTAPGRAALVFRRTLA